MQNDNVIYVTLESTVDAQSLEASVALIREKLEGSQSKVENLRKQYDALAHKDSIEGKNLRAQIRDESVLLKSYSDELKSAEKNLASARAHNARMAENTTADRNSYTAQRMQARLERKEQAAAVKALKKRIKISVKGLGTIGRIARKLESVTIARIARGLLNAVINAARTGVQDLYKWSQSHNGTFAKAMDSIKEDFRYIADIVGSVVGPFIEALAPKIRALADAFAEAAERANQFFATLLGRNGYYKAIRVAQQYGALQNQLLGFDELNVLKGDSGSGGGNFIDVAWNGLEGIGKIGEAITTAGKIQMGIGVFLMFAGHPLIGAGLIAAGFANVIAARGDDPNSKLQKFLKKASVIATSSMLAIGAILLPFKPLVGIALLAAGVAGLYPAVALNADSLKEIVQGPLAAVMAILGGFFAALGVAMLLNPATIGLGVALLAAGLTSMVTPIALNKDAIVAWVKDPLVRIMSVIGSLSIAIGGILLLCPATFGIGAGLIAAGFATKAAAYAINPDAAVEAIRNIFNKIDQTIKNIWGATVDWVKSKWDSFMGWFRNLADKLDSWLADTFGKTYGIKIDYGTSSGAVAGAMAGVLAGYVEPYALGGTPKTGSLFYAGEAGPELVTSFNGQSTVYNETQLTGSIAEANEGVVNAIYDVAQALIAAVNSSKDVNINVNDLRSAINTQSLRYGL